MEIKSKRIMQTDEDAEPGWLATIATADPAVAQMVLDANPASLDGRSQFVWVRLANGDLILGVYPQGDTYFDTEVDGGRP
jgi:hypothetical protein